MKNKSVGKIFTKEKLESMDKPPYISRTFNKGTELKNKLQSMNNKKSKKGNCTDIAVHFAKSIQYPYEEYINFDSGKFNIQHDITEVAKYQNANDQNTMHQGNFGNWLIGRFKLLEDGKTGTKDDVKLKAGDEEKTKEVSWERFTLDTGNHSLGCQIAIKPGRSSGAGSYYVVTLLEPNMTNQPIRATYHKLEKLKDKTLQELYCLVDDTTQKKPASDMIRDWKFINKSTPEIISLFTRPERITPKNKQSAPKKSYFHFENVTREHYPHVANHLMQSNDDHGYKSFIEHIVGISPLLVADEWADIFLAEKTIENRRQTGLGLALDNGQLKVIQAFCKAMSTHGTILTSHHLKKILQAKEIDTGVSIFGTALLGKSKNHLAITELTSLLGNDALTKTDREAILMCGSEGLDESTKPEFFSAIRCVDIDTRESFDDLLQNLLNNDALGNDFVDYIRTEMNLTSSNKIKITVPIEHFNKEVNKSSNGGNNINSKSESDKPKRSGHNTETLNDKLYLDETKARFAEMHSKFAIDTKYTHKRNLNKFFSDAARPVRSRALASLSSSLSAIGYSELKNTPEYKNFVAEFSVTEKQGGDTLTQSNNINSKSVKPPTFESNPETGTSNVQTTRANVMVENLLEYLNPGINRSKFSAALNTLFSDPNRTIHEAGKRAFALFNLGHSLSPRGLEILERTPEYSACLAERNNPEVTNERFKHNKNNKALLHINKELLHINKELLHMKREPGQELYPRERRNPFHGTDSLEEKNNLSPTGGNNCSSDKNPSDTESDHLHSSKNKSYIQQSTDLCMNKSLLGSKLVKSPPGVSNLVPSMEIPESGTRPPPHSG